MAQIMTEVSATARPIDPTDFFLRSFNQTSQQLIRTVVLRAEARRLVPAEAIVILDPNPEKDAERWAIFF
jgi:hypothetical protein